MLNSTHYDYIITGGGAAGLSLVYRLLNSSLRHKRILIIDREQKNQNDRTWCFWEKTPGPFEHIVYHQWKELWFHQGVYSQLLNIAPYIYKVIRGIDFYKETGQAISHFPNVERLDCSVDSIRNTVEGVEVIAGGQCFTSNWCFNSIFFGPAPDKSKVNYLDQHFRGWFILAEKDTFNPGHATLMDFRTPQSGETRFVYVLPFSTREALVEVAIFSNNHLQSDQYDDILRAYLSEHMPGGAYQITNTEQGNIPMTDFLFSAADGHIVHLGMAGGDTRASTGYTFWNIQQRVERIVTHLEQSGTPLSPEPLAQQRARRYDTLLLHVLEKKLFPGDELFGRLFKRNPPSRILAFLNAESTFAEEFMLMQTSPVAKFLRALGAEVFLRFISRKSS